LRFFGHSDSGISRFPQPRPVERRQKVPFDLGETASGNRRPRDKNELHRLREFVLVPPERFPEQAPRAAAFHRAANFPARNDAKPGRRASRQPAPVGDETALREPLALLPDTREIAAVREPRSATQPQALGVWRPGSGV